MTTADPVPPPRRPTRSRLVALGALVAVVGGVAAADAVWPPPHVAPPPVPSVTALAPDASVTSSWYCAGGSVGAGSTARPVVELANPTGRTVAGTATTVVAGTAASGVRRDLSVPAHGVLALDPSAGAPGAGPSATTIVLAGGGVAAEQVVAGPAGWSMAPCASSTAATWYLAGGTTTAGNQLSLSVFNPTSGPAVVGLSFDTPAGVLSPQPYQGIVIPPGGVVVEHLGDFVQDQPDVTTIVSASSGQVVADALQQRSSSAGTGLSVLLGAPTTSSTWDLAPTTDVPGGTVVVHLANPGTAPVTATIGAVLAEASIVPVTVTVPPQSSVVFRPTSTPRFPLQTPYALTVQASGGLVVTRTVGAPSGMPAWGDLRGTPAPATRWVVPAPGVPGSPGLAGASRRTVAVSNTGSMPATVEVTTLSGARVATLHVPAGSLDVLGNRGVVGLSWLVVRSDVPVVVGADSAPTGVPGVVGAAGFPWGG